jgi:DNA-binding IclR family transcriptional regulator
MLGTVGKASRLLDLFTNARPEWGVTEAALALGVPRSSAHDLLDTLACTGLLRRVDGNRYRLGLKLLALSSTALDSLTVRTQARPVMEMLARKLSVNVHLAMLQDDDVLYLDSVSAGPRIALPGVGRRHPLHCTAVGKALLSHQTRSTVTLTLDRLALEPVTEHSICSVDTLVRELDAARRAGVARDREGSADGVCCHAAPIIERGAATAAISISVALSGEQRLAERYDEIVRAAALRISHSLAAASSEIGGERVAV